MSVADMRIKENDLLIRLRDRLTRAIEHGRSDRWCLALWSRFIRARDGYQCIVCDSDDRIEAHHVFRRTLVPRARYETGNGITLCRKCHKVAHEGFNGRPDLSLPIGAQGGDDQDEIAFYYLKLLEAAEARDLAHDEFYAFSNEMLYFFVKVQGFEQFYWRVQEKEITGLIMAYNIWRRAPEKMTMAVLRANLPEFF
ncbi:HNH endonuclease [Pseudomonas sp. Z1-29]|uniref:HNH endonuclease n=1 Tax=Pseudomonas sp. Z1-29 TaxID=2817410 RepID=UPI003DA8E478